MRKSVVFSLLVCLAGYGIYQLDDTKSSAMAMAPTWFPQEEEEEAPSEEADEEVGDEETVDSIIEEFNSSMQEFMQAYNAAESQEDKRKVFQESYPQPNSFAKRLMVLVEEDPTAESSADALAWVVQRVRGPMSNEATDLLIEHHIKSEAMADIAMTKGRDIPTEDNQAFLQQLIDESPIDRVKGAAAYNMVMQIQQGKRRFQFMKDAAQDVARQLEEVDTESDDEAEQQKIARLRAQVAQFENFRQSLAPIALSLYEEGQTEDGTTMEAMFEELVANYGDTVLSERDSEVVTVADRCEGILFEIRYLSIGKEAPDIEGADLDGEEFKLSDYRGKVVVIDFWGDW